MRNSPYWFNIGSILHQYGCATRVNSREETLSALEMCMCAVLRCYPLRDRPAGWLAAVF